MAGIFDPAIFDPAIFDTGSAVVSESFGGGLWFEAERAANRRRRKKHEHDDQPEQVAVEAVIAEQPATGPVQIPVQPLVLDTSGLHAQVAQVTAHAADRWLAEQERLTAHRLALQYARDDEAAQVLFHYLIN